MAPKITKEHPSQSEKSAFLTQDVKSKKPSVQLKDTRYTQGKAALSPGAAGGFETQQAALKPPPLQMKGGSVQKKDIHEIAAQGTRGSGSALPHGDAIQAAFGRHDVSGVQAHTGGAAAEANKSMGAEAYASGNNIAFKGAPDLHTAAHEAAHIVQQRAGVSLSGGVGQTGDKYEQHANTVADAVVQGKSAESLLDTMAGGSGSDNVQRKQDGEPIQAAGVGGAMAAGVGSLVSGDPLRKQHLAEQGGASPPKKPKRYRVEYKAWIPHKKVVDPEEKLRTSDWFDTITDLGEAPLDIEYEFNSYYHGDDHAGYDGSHRVKSYCVFDWDGKQITNFQHFQSIGLTKREYDWDCWLDAWLFGRLKTISKGSNAEYKRASGDTSGSAGRTSFQLGMSSANPLVMGPSPNIDGSAVGQFTGNTLNLSYTTDMFPSHGIRVYENGAQVSTRVVNNAAGVPGLGARGAVEIGIRLNLQGNSGNYNVP